MSIALDALLVEADLPPLGGEGGKGEAQGVGAVLLHHHQRVDDVTGRLRHLLAVLVAYQGMEVDILKGHLVHEV